MYDSPNLGTHIIVNKSIKQNYSGSCDEESGMSEGIGCTMYSGDDSIQCYEGEFVWDNMHGYGEYQWEPQKCKHEGHFYVNRKEGYGRFSYPSGAYFEGLYRNDQRFGPGIYTDAAGYQDVGIWVASKLIRLSRIFEPDHRMPRLAVRDEDKIRILRYRKIIHLQKDEVKHIAENLLESLTHLRNYDKSVLARAEELYNRLCRDIRAPSFNNLRYDKTFSVHESHQLTIDVLMTEKEIQQKIVTEKEKTTVMDVLPSVDVPQIKESQVIQKKYQPEDIPVAENYVGKVLERDENVEIFPEKAEEEYDYCGIKEIGIESLNDIHLSGNHEKQWNIFQSSAITISQASSENLEVNFTREENLHDSIKTEALEEEFDEFGRKKMNYVQPTKKIVVTDLMAWNNSPLLIELLKHVFKHRNFEKKLTFDISKILAGSRGSFRQEGAHEKAVLELFEACSSGCQNKISKLILRHDLDVDVADGRGNTGLLLAAARDRIEVIDILLNFGANVDNINDECLTPLSLCVLRLLELIHSVTDWSRAFLPKIMMVESITDDEPVMFENVEQWHGRVSYESLVQKLPRQMDWNPLPSKIDSIESAINKDVIDTQLGIVPSDVIKARTQAEQRVTQQAEQHTNMQKEMRTQKYIFDMLPIIEIFDPWRKYKNGKAKNRNIKTKIQTTTDKKLKEKNISSKREELSKNSKRIEIDDNSEVSAKKEIIHTTISKLLQRGADPNFAQVPYPVLIMAIFTRIPSLIPELLQHGADPNTTLSRIDHSLTPLLILSALQPAYEHALMAKALLEAKADPSLRADPNYRSDLFERLNKNRSSEFIDRSKGITALHLLAIRPDIDADVNEHLGELIGVICQHKCNKKSDLYQGHSPLSLAIFSGNLTAAKAFLRTTHVNANEQLGADLGNAMLMLESCLLQELLPPDLLQEFLKLLLEHGGCPFVSAKVLNEEYNQIEYGRKEFMKISSPSENKIGVKQKKNKMESKGFRSSKPRDTRNFAKSMDFVEKVAKERLIETIKANFIRDLMDSPVIHLPIEKHSELLKDPLLKPALTWMTGEDVAIAMKTMNYSRGAVRHLVRIFATACIMPQRKTLIEMNSVEFIIGLLFGGESSTCINKYSFLYSEKRNIELLAMQVLELILEETGRIMNKVMPLVDTLKQIELAADSKVDIPIGKLETKKLQQNVVCQLESDPQNNRFKVCFECLTVHGKVLILCPECKRVYFCSQECNFKCTTQEGNPHQCPVFYQKEWIRLEMIATTVDLDPINYMLERFKSPEIYIDLEKKTGLSIEPRGNKKSLKMQGDNTYANSLKCKNQHSTVYKENVTDQFMDENVYEDKGKDDDARVTKRKQKKREEIMRTEYNNCDIESKKQQKKDRKNIENTRAGTGDIKSNREKTDDMFDNVKDRDHGMKSKKTYMKGHRLNMGDDNKGALNKVRSIKGSKINRENSNSKNERVAKNNMEWKRGKKNTLGFGDQESKGSGENKMKLKKDKKEEGNIKKLRKGKTTDQEEDERKEIKNKNNYWRGKEGEKTSNQVGKNKFYIVNDNREKKQEAKWSNQEWKNVIHKTMRIVKPEAPIEKLKNNRRRMETNVPEKYLELLLKASKVTGVNLDLDMPLLPYVVFAQGDTYFRILQANQYPTFAENYSLI